MAWSLALGGPGWPLRAAALVEERGTVRGRPGVAPVREAPGAVLLHPPGAAFEGIEDLRTAQRLSGPVSKVAGGIACMTGILSREG